MMAVLRLVRLPNLIVVAITQWLLAVPIIATTAISFDIASALNYEQLSLVILATLSISAAGYGINDILDHPIDMINRPDKVVVGRQISLGSAYWLVSSFTVFGFVCALIVAFQKDQLIWLWLYPLFCVLLGGYTQFFKTHPFVGNVFISLSCAAVAGLVYLAERSTLALLPTAERLAIEHIFMVFMLYAFLATWIREIVKDLEDYRGDHIGGRRTLPIFIGETKAKFVVHVLAAILAAVLLLYAFLWISFDTQPIAVLLSVCLAVCVLALQWGLIKAKDQKHYHLLSRCWKFFMLGGLILLFFYKN